MASLLWLMGVVLSASGSFAAASSPSFWPEASVYRDEWGVPHVYGATWRDMAFAFGYTQAEDHLADMLRAYRIANGRAAEVWGEEFAESDAFAIKLAHAELAESALLDAHPVVRDLCIGFAMGANAWMFEHPDTNPDWAEPVRPDDILALLHCYLMSYAPFDLPDTWRRAAGAHSGNAWAVAPARSATGETLLVINPHTNYKGPFQWYEAHLATADYEVVGATLFGLPIILQGHNGTLGWGLTPNQPDFADVFIEAPYRAQTNPNVPRTPRFAEQEILFEAYLGSQVKPYYVRHGDDFEERQVLQLQTSRGPVVGEWNGRLCSYSVGGYYDLSALLQLVAMGRARNLRAFQEALLIHQIPCFHVLYADREGNLFYLYNAKVATKFEGLYQVEGRGNQQTREWITTEWEMPVRGNNLAYQWGDLVPVSALPSVVNPAAGFLQTCGTTPWYVTDNAGLSPSGWPIWFVRDRETPRAERVRRLLRRNDLTLADMQAMFYDTHVPIALEAVPRLLDIADANRALLDEMHPDLLTGLDVLRAWNYDANPDSAGMTFFDAWWRSLRELAGAGLDDGGLFDGLMKNEAEVERIALEAAEEAARRLRNAYGRVEVPWGDVHRIARGEANAPLAGGGTGGPVFTSESGRFEDGAWWADYGSAFAMAVRFGARSEAVSVVPFGVSQDPESVHYNDQFALFTERRFKPVRFTPDAVQRHTSRATGRDLVLQPQGIQAVVQFRAEDRIEARLLSESQPPAPFPTGLAAFTLNMRPEWQHPETPVQLDMEIYIPAEICAADSLGQLALYVYETASGWTRVAVQETDSRERVIRARDGTAGVYAVLGAAEHRLPVPPSKSAVQPGTLKDSYFAKAIADLEWGRRPPTLPAAIRRPGEGRASVPKPSEEPEEPVEFKPEPDRLVTERDEIEPSSSTPETEPKAESAATRSGESFMGSLEEARRRFAPKEKEVRVDQADVKAAGPTAYGTMLDLSSADGQARVHLTAESSIRGRVLTLAASPAPYPDGLANFTDVLKVESSGQGRGVNVALSLFIAEDICAAELIPQLTLYAYDPERGWNPLPGQKGDSKRRVFTAIDLAPRVYAVLGPTAHRLRAP
jgi:acyl-homoserine-lactone acylase